MLRITKQESQRRHRHSGFAVPSSLDIHSSFQSSIIATDAQLAELVPQINAAKRVALDLRQTACIHLGKNFVLHKDQRFRPPSSIVGLCDFIVDRLSNLDLQPMRGALEPRELFARRRLRSPNVRRGLNFTASKIFDTVVAARLLQIREFSLGALVKRFFGVELHKHSQKANWALRPLPTRMLQYAVDDVHYLFRLAAKLEEELQRAHRRDWFRQSCERAIELAVAERERDQDELRAHRRSRRARSACGSGSSRAMAMAGERKRKWQIDRHFIFYISHEGLKAAESFISGHLPDYKHFSARRRQVPRSTKVALQSPESDWPVMRRRTGSRPTVEMRRRADQLRERRDKAAEQIGVERSSLHRAALSRLLQLTLRGQRPFSFPGNTS